MKKTNTTSAKNVVNRRALFDYELGEEILTGMSLTGPEVRAVRDGRVSLKGAFVTIRNDKKGNSELWLNNASFSLKNTGEGQSDAVDTFPKKLLATRKQIDELEKQKQSGFTIVPTKLFAGKRYIKLAIALGKGKKLHDKRETLKRKQADRESARMMKRF